MTDDLISRADAIKAVSKVDDYGDGIGFEVRSHCLVELEMLPSAQPKHGEWIWQLADNGWADHICSACGYTKNTDIHVSLGWKYCPNCGARMTERSE